jgi:hypothetical protein
MGGRQDIVDTEYEIALIYADQGRVAEAINLLEEIVQLEIKFQH